MKSFLRLLTGLLVFSVWLGTLALLGALFGLEGLVRRVAGRPEKLGPYDLK